MLQSGMDKTLKEGVGPIGAAFKFRVKLHAYIKGPVCELYGFYQPAVGRSASEREALALQKFTELVVEFIAVPVAFADAAFLIAALHCSARCNVTGISAQTERAALIDIIALAGHKIDYFVPALLVKFSGIGI